MSFAVFFKSSYIVFFFISISIPFFSFFPFLLKFIICARLECYLQLKGSLGYCIDLQLRTCNVMVFSFLPKKMCTLFQKNATLCLFLKNVSPSKRVICSILNILHFPMVKSIAFYALHKSRVLIIPCKADGFRLFIGLPDEI